MQYSIVKYKTVKENSDFRIDADYYHPVYLRDDLLVAKFQNVPLGEFAFVTDGQHGYHEVDENSPISHLTAKNAKNWFADTENADKLAKWVDDKNKRSSLKEGDLILSTRGTVGFCSLVFQDVLPANIDQDIARIAIKGKTCLPEFLLTYFNSQFGQDWIKRNISGMVQQGLSLQKVRTAPIPLFNDRFQKIITKVILDAKKHIDQSKSLYSQAEQLLLSELELLDWKPKHELTFVKNFSATQESERFDAEYFQPRYEEIVEAVKKYKGGFIGLKEVAITKRGSLISDSFYNIENGTCYIRGADFSDGFLSNNRLVYIDNSFIPKSEVRVKTDDIVFALIGTVGSTALVDDSFNGAFISNNIGKIVVKNYNPIVLQVLLHSIVGKQYFEKEKTQTAQPKISDKDIHKFILPKLENDIEKEIEEKYIESQKRKILSKSLLEIAKQGVEMAIENDEQKAEKWIDEKLKEIKIEI